MSRVVAEDYSLSRDSSTMTFHNQSTPIESTSHHLQPPLSATATSPTLGQLLKNVSDVHRENTGDGSETPVHQVLELGSTDLEVPRSIPFVLSFNNLTYSVKVSRKFKLPSILPGRNTHLLGSATDSDPIRGESQFTTTKTLLNDISGEARDGEIMAVLGASGSGKSTLIDALANRIAKGKLERHKDVKR
ncbi:hypothetical protein OIU76_013171 [Salix suchowensis]|nr:hypothetical protein OIU76_013171 [Salix suchowensis]